MRRIALWPKLWKTGIWAMIETWGEGIAVMLALVGIYFLWQIHERLNTAVALLGMINKQMLIGDDDD
jgi:hypothetical protein